MPFETFETIKCRLWKYKYAPCHSF